VIELGQEELHEFVHVLDVVAQRRQLYRAREELQQAGQVTAGQVLGERDRDPELRLPGGGMRLFESSPQGVQPPRADRVGAARDRGRPRRAAAVVAARRQAASFRGWPGGGQASVQRNPVRPGSGLTEGVGTVTTTFTTSESPFKSDHTASNMCGFTLMNNQVGAVVAQALSKESNVRVTPLPSMIRVDAVRRMDVVYDEVSEALGEEPGFFDAAEFEENMSTHYGRMIHLDDRTILFANPEDAAEYIGFDLTAG
jgi:propane monooxygenase coupling protein